MITIVFLSLFVGTTTLLGLGLAIFLRAAFRGEQDIKDEARTTWRPAFVRGEALRDWAAAKTEEFLRPRLSRSRGDRTSVEIVTELGEHVAQAMLPLARTAELERAIACPPEGQGRVELTSFEARAILTRLRETKSPHELQRMLELSRANVNDLAANSRNDVQRSPRRCPLQDDNGICCVYSVRPLHCRPLHAMAIASTMRDCGIDESHDQTVVEGVTLGFKRALQVAGLDANSHELNATLAAGLASCDRAAVLAERAAFDS